eukprot:8609785-Ditylum_brightwellii.AAC.1
MSEVIVGSLDGIELGETLGSKEGNKLGLLDGDAVVLEVTFDSLDGVELGSKEGNAEGNKLGLLDGD